MLLMLLCSTIAVLIGFILDAIFGDPRGFPHIIRVTGGLINALEKLLRRVFPATRKGETAAGVLLVCITALCCTAVPLALLILCYRLFLPLGFLLECFLCFQLLAAKSLKTESMAVFYSLEKNDIKSARRNLSMIVGRDVSKLDSAGITRATVETVAENASDGCVAPLLYITLGGAAFGCFYKAVNTMDSMVGYKNKRYLRFGRAAAKLDDALNFIPSRLCALLMLVVAFMTGYNGKNAYRIWRRDRLKHPSPNSAQTESVCAGALGIRLAGPAVYFGELSDKPYIGDGLRNADANDIISANKLMYASTVLMTALSLTLRIILIVIVK